MKDGKITGRWSRKDFIQVVRTVYVNEVARFIYVIASKLLENKNGQNGNLSILSTEVRKTRPPLELLEGILQVVEEIIRNSEAHDASKG